jgi:transcriptional regulator
MAAAKSGEMLQGTLDMLVLRTLVMGDAHGHTIAKVIERTSEDVLEVEQGSLYPALHRLEDRGWVSSYWGASENNRKAKFYRLTAAGRKQLAAETSRWRQMARAIGLSWAKDWPSRQPRLQRDCPSSGPRLRRDCASSGPRLRRKSQNRVRMPNELASIFSQRVVGSGTRSGDRGAPAE